MWRAQLWFPHNTDLWGDHNLLENSLASGNLARSFPLCSCMLGPESAVLQSMSGRQPASACAACERACAGIKTLASMMIGQKAIPSQLST